MKISHTLLAAAAALVIAPSISFAAKQSYDLPINVTADVQDPAGLVVSDPTNWTQNAIMSYNHLTDSLNPVSGNIMVKSPESITAYLTSPPALTSAANGTSIPLKVLVDNTELGLVPGSAATVAAKGQATNGKSINVKIDRSGTGALAIGNYTGTINVLFESDIP